MSLRSLPPIPPGCRTLSDEESRRLNSLYPSPWKHPMEGCLTCSDRRQLKARVDGQIDDFECDCRGQWKMHRWLLNAGLGLSYQRRTIDDVESAQVLEAIAEATQNTAREMHRGIGTTLWSQGRGNGKTLAATLILKQVMATGVDGYFSQFNDLIEFSTRGWRDPSEQAWFARRVRNVDLLVIDDIGRENKGRVSVVEAMLDQVIRHRVASSKPTIITTNLTPDEMQNGYGPNVLSLLSEVNREVGFTGLDHREKAQRTTVDEVRQGISRPILVG